ncbi:unnamed protein product, partial [Gordionus sp. m RMFG-2023]
MDLIHPGKLIFEGYSYTIHKKCSIKIRWRCSKYSSFKCRAILFLTLDNQDPVLDTAHNHPSNIDGLVAMKSIANMKKRCADSLAKPLQIYAEEIVKLDQRVQSHMLSEDSIKRTLRNHKAMQHPSNLENLEDLVIEGDWANCGSQNSKRFLLFDNGPQAEERIIMFATDDSLNLISNRTEWYMDGNFAMSPKNFLQLYVIRVAINNIFITAVYCVLQKKTQSTYEIIFQTIMSKCQERDLFPD